MSVLNNKLSMPTRKEALPGRTTVMVVSPLHFVNNNPIKPPFPSHIEKIIFGLGCFWGAEKKFWQEEGVYSTAVGYSAGFTPNATYEEVCTGLTGHNEVVLVMFDPNMVSFEKLLTIFWESHNPTQGMRQGNDKGTQYRSGIYTFSEDQLVLAENSKKHYGAKLGESNYGIITTEIMPASEFYYAEDFHQQYLAKNPRGYCGLGGLGINY
ncbi:MAG: peptide-methionine (S)-S-oxide reductase MsrA [Gammaproteobacteria bacterium]|nr:peptide-methionine (S)-S-oxide reductase MsrA [Gammaproteobacteria bacterium]